MNQKLKKLHCLNLNIWKKKLDKGQKKWFELVRLRLFDN